IIPALNEAKYLPLLLDDLSKQTFLDFEVIVVDGNSDDQTVAKAKSFAQSLPRLTILSSPTRHVCVQRNLGAKHAKADIFIFMDADNRLPPYFLQGIKYRWESDPTDILSCWLKPDIITPSNETIATALNLFLELQNNLKPTYLLEGLLVICKQCFKNIGGFDETVNYAEGKSLIRAAISHGYTSKVVRDPIYTYSFRRLRKYGTINMVSRITKMELYALLGQDSAKTKLSQLYPMLGGTSFSKSFPTQNRFLKRISQILQDL
ncbi:MAG: glycosyltransferase, partial [bacterium]